MKLISSIATCCLLLVYFGDCVPNCPVIKSNPISIEIPKDKHINAASASDPAKIRIKVEFDSTIKAKSNYVYLNNMVENAVSDLSSLIKVRYPASSKIIFPRLCVNNRASTGKNSAGQTVQICTQGCLDSQKYFGLTIPEKYLSKCYYKGKNGETKNSGTDGLGLENYDLVLLVGSTTNNCKSTVFAWAADLYMEDAYNRPVMALLNICYFFNQAFPPIQKYIITHEILHNLAFSPYLYAFFRDENGKPRTPRNSQTGQPSLGTFLSPYNFYKPDVSTLSIYERSYDSLKLTDYKMKTYVINTPKVLSEVREHFGCQTARGLILEDFQDSISHIDNLYFATGLMNMYMMNDLRLSRIEMALLEDSGWYIPDYSQAETLVYGKGLGCAFSNFNCYNYIDKYPYCKSEYMADGRKYRCDPAHTVIEGCEIITHLNDLNDKFQYFSNKRLGGPRENNNYCPAFSSQVGLNCKHSELNQNANLVAQGHYFGANAICVDMSSQPIVKVDGVEGKLKDFGAQCLRVECPTELYSKSAETAPYKIYMFDKVFECKSSGQVINIEVTNPKDSKSGFRGNIKCPDYQSACFGKTSTTKSTEKIVIALNLSIASWASIFLIYLMIIAN